MDVVKQLPTEAEASRSTGPLPQVLRIVRGPSALRRWAIVSLVMNIAIVVTGGLVRLTGSGLGCPTWPRCTEDSTSPILSSVSMGRSSSGTGSSHSYWSSRRR